MFKNSLFFLLSSILLFSAACGFFGLQNKLTGKWINQDTQESWIFGSDNSLKVVEEFSTTRTLATGTYRVIDDETIGVDIVFTLKDGTKEPTREALKVQFREDRMYLKGEGFSYVFKKAER